MSEFTTGIYSTEEQQHLPARFTPKDKAVTFCQNMRHEDAPVSVHMQYLARLQQWGLLPETTNLVEAAKNYKGVKKLSHIAERTLEEVQNFPKLFEESPWNMDGCIEGEYTESELAEKYPIGIELQKALGGEAVKFVFRVQPAECYLRLVVREDGRRQLVRIVDTNRPQDLIKKDLSESPKVLPHIEALQLPNGQTALLLEWIDGHPPTTTEEKALCISESEGLTRVPMETYDLWRGNFLVTNSIDPHTLKPRVVYIDRDVPETIARKGYCEETAERRALLVRGKEKME